jgi:hypothetical protein
MAQSLRSALRSMFTDLRRGPEPAPSLSDALLIRREFFGVVARPELSQHVIEVCDGKDETPLVGIVEQHRGDLAHTHDEAIRRLVELGLKAKK